MAKYLDWKKQTPSREYLSCYDTLGDDSFDMDRDDMLQHRSLFEFVKDELSQEVLDDLAMIDQYWKDNSKLFNNDFSILHNLPKFEKDDEITFYIKKYKLNVLHRVPKSHWWWWAIPVDKQE